MTIQWTQRARRQFLAILDRILADNPSAAMGIYDTITDSIARLSIFPEVGRPGRGSNTRELVIPALPYIVAYRVRCRTVQILAIMHGAQKWPEHF